MEELQQIIKKDFIESKTSPYNFLPNNEQTGIGGCSHIDCKIERAIKASTALGTQLFSKQKEKPKENDFYFFWKLKQAIEKKK